MEITPEELRNQIEAILFASGKKLDVQFLKELTGVDNVRKVKNALLKIKNWYDENNPVLMITEEGDFWKINVREKYSEIVRKILSETELSKSILETLSVIAWKSPALQSEIIDIRSSAAYDHISELETAGFVTKEKHGRSYILKITNKFFEYFDIAGTEGIREVFKKIKEMPEQKKVNEFNEDNKEEIVLEKKIEKLGDLDVVNVKNDVEEILDADTEMLGELEIIQEEKVEEESDDEFLEEKSVEEIQPRINNYDEVENEVKVNQSLENRTKEIVDSLLNDEEEPKHKINGFESEPDEEIEEEENEKEEYSDLEIPVEK